MDRISNSIKFEELVRNVCIAAQSKQQGISLEGTQKLNLFIKQILLDAKTDVNKSELMTVLDGNDPDKLFTFIMKHVKDFPEKFHEFVYKEVLE